MRYFDHRTSHETPYMSQKNQLLKIPVTVRDHKQHTHFSINENNEKSKSSASECVRIKFWPCISIFMVLKAKSVKHPIHELGAPGGLFIVALEERTP